jgi:sulfoxide reductase heme-binding subunit YedZ
MLGLFAFFYAFCHLNVYIVFDQFFDWPAILRDTIEKKFVFAGMLALLLMIPLAITSTNGWIKRLGGKRWQRLHKLVYIIAIAAVIHFIWLVKADLTEPFIYALILAFLLGIRIVSKKRKNQKEGSIAWPT